MPRRAYRMLLYLLPRRRRARYGHDMLQTFDDLYARERARRGVVGVLVLWAQEVAGIARFIVREWLAVAGDVGRGPGLVTELRWAWRGVAARGWRAGVLVGLLALTLAANASTFSVADSLVFRRQPYADADRIVALSHAAGPGERIGRQRSAALYREWRGQRDIFAAAGAYLRKTVFLLDGGTAERVPTADVTVDLFDVLGVAPRWGRGFGDQDLEATEGFVAILSERLATQRFGRPDLALGRRLEATGGPLLVVGVMPDDFAFPSASFQIWRALDPDGVLTTSFAGVDLLARFHPSPSIDDLHGRLEDRAAAVGRQIGLTAYSVEVDAFAQGSGATERRTMLVVLLGAALCLLVTACVNVASLELATSVQRARTSAVQLALGASRPLLVRVAALEAALMIGASVAGGLLLAWTAVGALTAYLPQALVNGTQNPIDLDVRAITYMAAIAGVSWLLSTLAPVLWVSRFSLLSFLTPGGRSTTASIRSVKLRQLLTTVEVGLVVTLVVVGALYARSYRELLAIEKGFDSRGVAEVSAAMPAFHFPSGADRARFMDRLVADLGALPGIDAVSTGSAPPSVGDSPQRVQLEIDGTPLGGEPIGLGRKWVDPAYFAVTRLPLRRGRYLERGDPTTNVVINETFARRFWPGGDAVGRSLRGAENSSFSQPVTVVGVVGDFRSDPRRMPDVSDSRLYLYTLWQPPEADDAPGFTPAARPEVDTGGSYGVLHVTVRMDSEARAPAVRAAVQRLDPRLHVAVALVDDMYAEQHADTLLAARVVGAFSALGFVVAIAGLYSVMAFLVVCRTREIGIRMALGADRRAIGRMVLLSSAGVVVAGAAGGSVTAIGISRWLESQLFGVSAADPATHLVVVAAVTLTALAACWHPARQATRVEPAVTLRAE